jgi:hypothetical protein
MRLDVQDLLDHDDSLMIAEKRGSSDRAAGNPGWAEVRTPDVRQRGGGELA